jgi:hypothetical protein
MLAKEAARTPAATTVVGMTQKENDSNKLNSRKVKSFHQ